jgi:hypothetical protein
LKELANQGHGPQRHEGDVTPQQLEDRAVKGFDPMTGTTTDGVHGGTHKTGRHATKINTPEDYVKAEEAMRQSKKFDEEAKKAKDAGIDTVVVDDVPLKDVLGDDYSKKLTGKTRLGSKNHPTGAEDTDFTDGTMKAIYKEDGKGGYDLVTMYPEPA